MQVFFGPAIRLINKLSYAGKLVVVALVFLLPICASLFVIASGYSEQIKVTEVELDGVAYTKPLLSLLRQVQAHRQAEAGGGSQEAARSRHGPYSATASMRELCCHASGRKLCNVVSSGAMGSKNR